jgi:hypothetical protein
VNTTGTALILATVVALPDAVDFDTQVLPVLTRSGCNSGACHGAAAGRGGFRLSLYGGDPAFDFESIVHELEGRRVNMARPDRSLVLLKPSEALDHEGGLRLKPDSAGANLVTKWIQDGTIRQQNRKLINFDVSPKSKVVSTVGQEIQFRCRAEFSDGTTEDVTQWTVLSAEDSSAVRIDKQTGSASVVRRGRHVVIARYLDRVIPVELIVPMSDDIVDLTSQPATGFIDEAIYRRLETLRIPVSPFADDWTFLRRVRLDLTGRLPAPNEIDGFMADTTTGKRNALVDRLLGSDEFNDYWTWRLATLFRIRPQAQNKSGAQAFHEWVRTQLKQHTPYDQMARALITAAGDRNEYGPANFFRFGESARDQAEIVSELFMGARLRCANCHNHPLDRWTQDDYHGLAAIFAKVDRSGIVKSSTTGEVTHPRTGEAAMERIPGDRFLQPVEDPRVELAEWLIADDNEYFAKAIVNRLWQATMGRGLVEPVDDLRSTNPATHPDLLKQLASDFVQNKFDLRHTLRLICTSRRYGRSARTNDGNRSDDRFYSHAIERPLEPEVLFDAVVQVTQVAAKFGDESGKRAVELFDSTVNSVSLDALGRCSREESCESSGGRVSGISRNLHLMNGDFLNARLNSASGLVSRLVDREDKQVIDCVYRRAFGRIATAHELAFWRKQLSEDSKRREIIEDMLWSLLTSREFMTNH